MRKFMLAALAMSAVISIGGCSGKSSGPSALPSLSVTPTVTVTRSFRPPSSKEVELAAARAVLNRYVALLNAKTSEHQANALAHLMAPGCNCLKVVSSIRTVARRHEHYYGRELVKVVRPRVIDKRLVNFLIAYDDTAAGLVASNGQKIDHRPMTKGYSAVIRIAVLRGAWRIIEIDSLTEGQQ